MSRRRAIAHVISFWVGYLAILWAFGFLKGWLPPRFAALGWGGASAVTLLGLTLFMLRREGRTLGSVGLRWSAGSVRRFIIGAGLGVAIYAIVILLISLSVGPVEITQVAAPSAVAVLTGVGMTLALASMEEIGFRAYSLWTLSDSFGIWWGQLFVAVAFTGLHVLYGWPLSSVLLGVFPSALLFGALAIATRGIACPLGLHVAINLCQRVMGQKPGLAVWHIGVSDAAASVAARISPIIGFFVLLACAIGITLWSVQRTRRIPLPAA